MNLMHMYKVGIVCKVLNVEQVKPFNTHIIIDVIVTQTHFLTDISERNTYCIRSYTRACQNSRAPPHKAVAELGIFWLIFAFFTQLVVPNVEIT